MNKTLVISSMMAMAGLSCAIEAPSVAGLDAGLTSSGSGGSDTPAGSGGSSSGATGGNNTTGAGGSVDPTTGTGGGGGSTGGSMGMGGSQGGSGGAPPGDAGGGDDASMMSTDVAKALNGLRIDDTCASPPATGATTCNHVMNPYHASKAVTMGGTTGTVYNVIVKIHGVVEPTIINGGSKPDMAGAPQFNLGGTPGDPTYQPWFLSISNPQATYYLNNFGFTSHTIHGINWQETIPIAAGAMVTLDVRDANQVEITNTQAAGGVLTFPGVPGSMNGGQFVQIDVVSAVPK
jgi:hypothetical protein